MADKAQINFDREVKRLTSLSGALQKDVKGTVEWKQTTRMKVLDLISTLSRENQSRAGAQSAQNSHRAKAQS